MDAALARRHASIIGVRAVAPLNDSLDALNSPVPYEAILAAINAISPQAKKKDAKN